LETGKLRTDERFYERWGGELSSETAWREFHRSRGLEVITRVPKVDAEGLLRRMIIPPEGGRIIPCTFLALKKLTEHGIVTCGLTNNFVCSSFLILLNQIIEPDSPYLPLTQLTSHILPYFTHFLQSAHLGIRKPSPEIFHHTLRVLNCAPHEVVFLDDIGSNLKAAQKIGIRGIRVRIGREEEAVRELEEVMGMRLRVEGGKL
jgi:epoxide hydrolase-like predicted phosphatase